MPVANSKEILIYVDQCNFNNELKQKFPFCQLQKNLHYKVNKGVLTFGDDSGRPNNNKKLNKKKDKEKKITVLTKNKKENIDNKESGDIELAKTNVSTEEDKVDGRESVASFSSDSENDLQFDTVAVEEMFSFVFSTQKRIKGSRKKYKEENNDKVRFKEESILLKIHS